MKRRSVLGFAMVESLVAVLLLAVGVIGTLTMQARAFGAFSDATQRAEATIATDKLIGLIRNDQANVASYALAAGATPGAKLSAWYNETQTMLPGASVQVTVSAVAGTSRNIVDVQIQWRRKQGAALMTHRVTAYVAGAA
ncbi:hypothetical protein [Massilia sp. TS11]|uniref:type IV pilus modification PilV family protein n=1 Tax=Massilia sp. TS11 TaxID=2908003 RepID=UPI001EDBCE63|nr:hypothetical protein [Massilia sp. TS11]MCG2583815.1 hypothetical protein [Massilia sp. TS11]